MPISSINTNTHRLLINSLFKISAISWNLSIITNIKSSTINFTAASHSSIRILIISCHTIYNCVFETTFLFSTTTAIIAILYIISTIYKLLFWKTDKFRILFIENCFARLKWTRSGKCVAWTTISLIFNGSYFTLFDPIPWIW